MYAFNKRFRATTYKGLPYISWACLVLGTITLSMSLGAYFQAKAPMVSMLLLLSGAIAYGYAINTYRNKDRARLNLSRFIGKRDKRTRLMGL